MPTIWRNIVLDGIRYNYDISNTGKVRNAKGHILKPWKRGQRKGIYLCVALCRKGQKKKIDIQRLVAIHFLPNPKNKPEVNHFDLNHFNNKVSNLEWVTRSENMQHLYFMKGTEQIEKIYRKSGEIKCLQMED